MFWISIKLKRKNNSKGCMNLKELLEKAKLKTDLFEVREVWYSILNDFPSPGFADCTARFNIPIGCYISSNDAHSKADEISKRIGQELHGKDEFDKLRIASQYGIRPGNDWGYNGFIFLHRNIKISDLLEKEDGIYFVQEKNSHSGEFINLSLPRGFRFDPKDLRVIEREEIKIE
jgi:hypothetical protein